MEATANHILGIAHITSQRQPWSRRRLARPIALLLTFTVLFTFARILHIKIGMVRGQSMAPSLSNGQLFLMKGICTLPELTNGDIVVVNWEGSNYIKRVYAKAGETVYGIDYREIPGRPDWIFPAHDYERITKLIRTHPKLGEVVRLTVPKGYIFVLGDARTNSYDSRHFGAVPVGAIAGKMTALFSTHPRPPQIKNDHPISPPRTLAQIASTNL